MQRATQWLIASAACAMTLTASSNGRLRAAEREPDPVALMSAIDAAKGALIKAQEADGSWKQSAGDNQNTIGTTSIALLALLSSWEMNKDDAEIAKGLDWLRRQEPALTKEISLMIQALAAAHVERDRPRVEALAAELDKSQLQKGPNAGSWTYSKNVRPVGAADHSNGYFAILGLRDAARIGVPLGTDIWRLARQHWISSQNSDGSWSYREGKQKGEGTGSMTSAGIAVLIIAHNRIQKAEGEMKGRRPNEDGSQIETSVENGCRWIGNHFTVKHNPGDGRWVLFYLDAVGRAGRLSRRRFFIDSDGLQHDWYLEGAEYLIQTQDQFTGTWKDGDTGAVVGTSMALMFLSKGRIGD